MITVAYDRAIFVQQARGGISRYFCELAMHLNKSSDFRAEIIAPVHCNEHLLESKVAVRGVHLTSPAARFARPRRLVTSIASATLLRLIRPTLVHHTYYFPYERHPFPAVLTVYDMIHEKLSAFQTRDDITTDMKRKAVARADLIICISENTRRDLVELFGIPESKTKVVHLGFSLMSDAGPKAPRGAERPYLLYVGHRSGYKNFERLLRAYARLGPLRRDLRIIAFGGNRGLTSDETTLMSELGIAASDVEQRNGDDDDLASLYLSAAGFVYPSLYEGFGIPPLEAMSFDCPVLCSNGGSLPEVVGDAARTFDPYQVDQIAQAITDLLESSALREELIVRGRERVKRFSWERCAAETMVLYRELAGRRAHH